MLWRARNLLLFWAKPLWLLLARPPAPRTGARKFYPKSKHQKARKRSATAGRPRCLCFEVALADHPLRDAKLAVFADLGPVVQYYGRLKALNSFDLRDGP